MLQIYVYRLGTAEIAVFYKRVRARPKRNVRTRSSVVVVVVHMHIGLTSKGQTALTPVVIIVVESYVCLMLGIASADKPRFMRIVVVVVRKRYV